MAFLRLVETTAAVDIDLFLSGRRVGRFQNVQQGLAIRQDYDRARIESTGGSSQTIVVARTDAADVDVLDNRPTVNATINTTVEPADTAESIADVTVGSTATLLAAADTAQKYLALSISENETGAIRVGESASISASRGWRLAPGDVVIVPTEGALYGIRESGVDVVVTATRFKR